MPGAGATADDGGHAVGIRRVMFTLSGKSFVFDHNDINSYRGKTAWETPSRRR